MKNSQILPNGTIRLIVQWGELLKLNDMDIAGRKDWLCNQGIDADMYPHVTVIGIQDCAFNQVNQ